MNTIKTFLQVFKDRSGATAIEYALIAGVICLAVIGGVSAVGQTTTATFTELNTKAFGS